MHHAAGAPSPCWQLLLPTRCLPLLLTATVALPSCCKPQVAPLALLVEKAGGHSSCDGLLVSGLDVEVKQHDQRTQICYGSLAEVCCPAVCRLL